MDREQLAADCAEIEKHGGSVLEYLAACGCVSPWGTWWRLQKEELARRDSQITDGKGRKDMQKITLEQKKRAVEIALEGGSPLRYLEECGSKTPSNMWWTIKKNLEKADPETYAKLTEKAYQKAEDAGEVIKVDITEDSDGGFMITPVEEPAAEPAPAAEEHSAVGSAPLAYDGFTVHCVENGFGRFFYDAKDEVLYWTTPDGEEVSLTPEGWKRFASEMLPKAMQILGVWA